jgi:hypothetical protein
MESLAAKRAIGGLAFFLAMSWATHVHAQFAAGSTWARTDAAGLGMTLAVEAYCNGGLRLIYQLPPMGGQPATTMTVDSPMNGSEVPVLVGGKPSGQTMALKRADDRHYSAVAKVKGQPFLTANATISPDGKTMTVETMVANGDQSQKVLETWVRK